ncbi:MAG: alpha/beta hydrolase, partial [Vicinamibacterales bacterium]
MRDTKALLGHLSVALLLASTAGLARATAQTPQGQAAPAQYETRMSATFTVLIQGARVGVESVTLARTGGGWLITGSGELYPPFDLVTRRFELTYGPDWQPQRLAIEGSYKGDLLALSTSFGLTQATSDVLQGGQRGSVTQTITPRTVVLPNNFLGAYAGLAPRLPELQAGGSLPVYIAPEGEYRATVLRVTPRRIITPNGPVDIREYDLRIDLPADPVPVQVWIDGDAHLARVVLQANGMVAVRDDLSSVLSRVEKIRVEGDADVFIPANGFNLAATVTTPAAPATGPAPREAPAVVLVGGAGPQDRDHMAYGVPVFGQIARALSQAGYFVVRYDRRGTGQSGGRVENADIDAYAGDVTQIVRWLRDRKDVDDDRIAVLGYGEG